MAEEDRRGDANAVPLGNRRGELSEGNGVESKVRQIGIVVHAAGRQLEKLADHVPQLQQNALLVAQRVGPVLVRRVAVERLDECPDPRGLSGEDQASGQIRFQQLLEELQRFIRLEHSLPGRPQIELLLLRRESYLAIAP